jgi:hypothetical protein
VATRWAAEKRRGRAPAAAAATTAVSMSAISSSLTTSTRTSWHGTAGVAEACARVRPRSTSSRPWCPSSRPTPSTPVAAPPPGAHARRRRGRGARARYHPFFNPGSRVRGGDLVRRQIDRRPELEDGARGKKKQRRESVREREWMEEEGGKGRKVISRAGSSVEGGGGLPRRTKWRKCRVSNLRVAKL